MLPGMTEEELARLSNRFQQASLKTLMKHGDMGLGYIPFTLRSRSETGV